MAYEQKTWKTGDVITADALNHIEKGIADIELIPGPQGPKGDTGAAGADGAEGAQGPKGDTGAAGKDAPVITGCTININGAVVSGQLTMSEGEPVEISGTYSVE